VVLLVVLADTHVRDGSARDLSPAVWRAIDGADAVLHAGDVVGHELLDRLTARAPTYAVLGNNDHVLAGRLPDRRRLEFEGVTIGMVHDSGARAGRGARLGRWFPGADLVVFGHSHDPCDAEEAGVRLFNPGSALDRRRQPFTTYGVIDITEGQVFRTETYPTEE
jgi:uncharacterized protein